MYSGSDEYDWLYFISVCEITDAYHLDEVATEGVSQPSTVQNFRMFFLDRVQESLKSAVSIGITVRKINFIVSRFEVIAEGQSKVCPAAPCDVIFGIFDVNAAPMPSLIILLILLLGEDAYCHAVIIR